MRRLSTFNSDSILCLSPVCGGNTLPNVCSWCNSICSSVAGQLEHLRRELYYFYSLSHRWQIWRCWTIMTMMMHIITWNKASSLSMARKFWSELLLAAPSPLTHSHANAKALSRCNPQLCWNQKIKNVCGTFLLCINHQQLTQFGSIFFSFRVSLIAAPSLLFGCPALNYKLKLIDLKFSFFVMFVKFISRFFWLEL